MIPRTLSWKMYGYYQTIENKNMDVWTKCLTYYQSMNPIKRFLIGDILTRNYANQLLKERV